jgi:hypothetical protein
MSLPALEPIRDDDVLEFWRRLNYCDPATLTGMYLGFSETTLRDDDGNDYHRSLSL